MSSSKKWCCTCTELGCASETWSIDNVNFIKGCAFSKNAYKKHLKDLEKIRRSQPSVFDNVDPDPETLVRLLHG